MLPRRVLASFLLGASAVSASTAGAVTGAVTGLLGGLVGDKDSVPVPVRRSITELSAEAGPQWDLYIQALRVMYDRDPSDPESFFQIAGIHGRPFTEYNNAGPMRTDGWGGYSTHGENLFIIWHRPFVAFFEQTLVKEAAALADNYPASHRSVYQQAARDLRAPYWDWALEPWLPGAVLPETVTVNAAAAGGSAVVGKTLDNPLYTFRFPREVMQGRLGAFNTYDRMYRCSDPKAANQNLGSRGYKNWLYGAFTRSKSFTEFATTASGGSSLEGVHNAVHWDAGCGGQFMDSQYSAFEPLFMLHHSNVDRLWAYWQAIHPDSSTLQGVYQGLSRFATPRGTLIGLDAPLHPFKQANGDWHTSGSVNEVRSFGYTYEGLEHWEKTEAEMKRDATYIINSLYGPDKPKPEPTSSFSSSSSSTVKPTSSSTKMSSSVKSTQTSAAGSSSGQTSTETGAEQASSQATTQSTAEQSSSQTSAQTSSKQSSQSSSQQPTQSSAEQSSVQEPAQTIGSQSSQSQPTAVGTVSSIAAGNLTTPAKSSADDASSTFVSPPASTVTSDPSAGTDDVSPSSPTEFPQIPYGNSTSGDQDRQYYVDIGVDVEHLPERPCAIEVSVDVWSAGSMVIMKMPETGVVHDSLSLSNVIAAAGLDRFTGDDLLAQILSRLHVTLRKPDGSSMDISGMYGLSVDIEEVDLTPPPSDFELPQPVESKTHVVVEERVQVPVCGVPY